MKICNTIILHDKIKQYQAWFTSGFELEEIGEVLKKSELITEFDFDYENRYEWFVADINDLAIQLNVSRRHHDVEPLTADSVSIEPIHVTIMYVDDEPADSTMDVIAELISKAMQTDVYTGFIDNVSGDTFTYRDKLIFRAK